MQYSIPFPSSRRIAASHLISFNSQSEPTFQETLALLARRFLFCKSFPRFDSSSATRCSSIKQCDCRSGRQSESEIQERRSSPNYIGNGGRRSPNSVNLHLFLSSREILSLLFLLLLPLHLAAIQYQYATLYGITLFVSVPVLLLLFTRDTVYLSDCQSLYLSHWEYGNPKDLIQKNSTTKKLQ